MIAGAGEEFFENVVSRHLYGFNIDRTARNVSAQLLAAFLEILYFRTVLSGLVEWSLLYFVVGDRNAETRSESEQFIFVHFFLLVGDVAAFAGLTHAVALDGLCQDHRGAAGVFDGEFISGVHFQRIVSAATEFFNLFIGVVFDQLQ